MDTITEARRAAGLEIQKLAEEFAQSDEAAFRRTRILCWVVVAVATVVILTLLIAGGDWRYLAIFWLVIAGLVWGNYALSSRRQRQQTGRLKDLAARWLSGESPPAV